MVNSEVPKSNLSSRITKRKKYLNVIYFIDSDKTRSFKLPLNIAYTFLAGATFLGLWLFTSMACLYLDQKKIGADKAQIQNLLSVIFQYQTRYDEIFEIAYEGLNSPATAKIEKKSETAPAPKQTVAEEIVEKGETTPTAAPATEPAVAEDGTAENGEFSVQIENMKEHLYGNELQASFDIRNLQGSQKASGFIWGVAKIEKEDGQIVYLTSPTSVNVDQTGEAKNIAQAYKFSIKFFKSKTLTFALPNAAGFVKEISVYVSDSEGQGKKGETLPVNIAFSGQTAPPPEVKPSTPDAAPAPIETTPSDAQTGSGTQSESSHENE
jgi:hypothetical protein